MCLPPRLMSPESGHVQIEEILKKRDAFDCKNFLREDTGSIYDFYEHIRDLGEGGSGSVWLGRQIVRADTPEEYLGRNVAIKVIMKQEKQYEDDKAIQDFRTEVELMKSLDHPNICRLLGVFEDATNIYLVMEYIEGGELFDLIDEKGMFSEEDAAEVIQQVASALTYCHKHGAVHHDIKPENILVVQNTKQASTDSMPQVQIPVKVIDFGFGSRLLCGQKWSPKVGGTFVYTAPEALKGDLCDEKVDLWALGCLLYVLLSGCVPFSGSACRSNIIDGQYVISGPTWEGVSAEALDLVKSLLVVDPKQRISAEEVLDHPWLQSRRRDTQLHGRSMAQHLKNMKSFSSKDVFRHVTTAIMARQMDESALHQLRNSFVAMDQNGDGQITMSEFLSAWSRLRLEQDAVAEAELDPDSPFLERAMKSTNSLASWRSNVSASAGSPLGQEEEAELMQIFHSADMDGSGCIDYTEFIAGCMDRRAREKEEVCWEAFRVFDLDGNGVVTYTELQQVLSSADLQDTFSEATLDQVWSRLTGEDAGTNASQGGARSPGAEKVVNFDQFLAALRGAHAGGHVHQAQQHSSEPSAKKQLTRGDSSSASTTRPWAEPNFATALMASEAEGSTEMGSAAVGAYRHRSSALSIPSRVDSIGATMSWHQSRESSAVTSALTCSTLISPAVSLPGVNSRRSSQDSRPSSYRHRRDRSFLASQASQVSESGSLCPSLPIASRRGSEMSSVDSTPLLVPNASQLFSPSSVALSIEEEKDDVEEEFDWAAKPAGRTPSQSSKCSKCSKCSKSSKSSRDEACKLPEVQGAAAEACSSFGLSVRQAAAAITECLACGGLGCSLCRKREQTSREGARSPATKPGSQGTAKANRLASSKSDLAKRGLLALRADQTSTSPSAARYSEVPLLGYLAAARRPAAPANLQASVP